jgi:DNA-binding SARP family transcriptional activator/pimeloyl-ACP methyl ester carboxylesterase
MGALDQSFVMARLELQLLGFPAARLDGRAVDLGLRKGLGLLAYLADARGPVGREMLAGLLWPDLDGEAARGRLRRTLHKVRVALQADVIDADRTSLALASSVVARIDTHAFEAACDAGDLDEALRLYGGDFLDGLSVAGCAAFEEWAFFRREALRSRLVQTLERQVERALASHEPRAAIPAATRLVGLDPLNEAAQRRLIAAYMHAGDRAGAERQYATCARLLQDELGVAPDARTQALLAARSSEETTDGARTRYAERRGLHLAYQVVGTGPLDILLVPGFVSHVERIWEEPRARAALAALAQMGRLVLFDRRGVGLSDRVGAAPTVEATADDLTTVMDAASSRRALLIGASEGGPGCIRFAARHPERLAGLVLYGSLARGSRAADYPFTLTRAQYEAWLRRLVGEWGGPAEIATFAPSLVGDRQAEGWWSGLLRAASSPGAIKAVLEALRDSDVRELLPQIRTPTLVLHRRGDRAVRVEAGRHLADAIPGARFVELDGDDHWLWAGDREAVLEQIRNFVRTVRRREPAA